MVDRQDSTAAVAVMEFATIEAAQQYCSITLAYLTTDERALMTNSQIEYLEDVPSADEYPSTLLVLGMLPQTPAEPAGTAPRERSE